MSTKNVNGNHENDLDYVKLPPIHKNGLGQPVQENGYSQKPSDGLDRRFQLERSLQYQSSGVRPKEVYQAAKQSKENLLGSLVGQDELKLKQQLLLRSESQLSQSSSLQLLNRKSKSKLVFRHNHDKAVPSQIEGPEDAAAGSGRSSLLPAADGPAQPSRIASRHVGLRSKGDLPGQGSKKSRPAAEAELESDGVAKKADSSKAKVAASQEVPDRAIFQLNEDVVQVAETPTLQGTATQTPERTKARSPNPVDDPYQAQDPPRPTSINKTSIAGTDENFVDNITNNYDPPPEIYEESHGHHASLGASHTDMNLKMSLGPQAQTPLSPTDPLQELMKFQDKMQNPDQPDSARIAPALGTFGPQND